MNKINWKEVWEVSKRYGNPSLQERWALYILLGLLAIFYLMYWLQELIMAGNPGQVGPGWKAKPKQTETQKKSIMQFSNNNH